MASDFLPCGTPCPVNTSNTPTVGDQRPVGALRRAQHVGRGDIGIEQEGEVALHSLQVRGVERRLGQGFAFGRWNGIEVKLETRERRIHAKLREHVGMKLAEGAERDLRPELERAGASRMEPGGSLPRHAEIALVDAEGGKRRHRVGLGGEHVGFRRLA